MRGTSRVPRKQGAAACRVGWVERTSIPPGECPSRGRGFPHAPRPMAAKRDGTPKMKTLLHLARHGDAEWSGAMRATRSRPRPTHYYGPRPPAAPRPQEDAARRHRELATQARRQRPQEAVVEARRAMRRRPTSARRTTRRGPRSARRAEEVRHEVRQAYAEVVATTTGGLPCPRHRPRTPRLAWKPTGCRCRSCRVRGSPRPRLVLRHPRSAGRRGGRVRHSGLPRRAEYAPGPPRRVIPRPACRSKGDIPRHRDRARAEARKALVLEAANGSSPMFPRRAAQGPRPRVARSSIPGPGRSRRRCSCRWLWIRITTRHREDGEEVALDSRP